MIITYSPEAPPDQKIPFFQKSELATKGLGWSSSRGGHSEAGGGSSSEHPGYAAVEIRALGRL